jgi:hypothetical protein
LQVRQRTTYPCFDTCKGEFNQKLDYIHYNPVKAGLCKLPEDYYYSSAKFYFDGVDAFEMLTHADE